MVLANGLIDQNLFSPYCMPSQVLGPQRGTKDKPCPPFSKVNLCLEEERNIDANPPFPPSFPLFLLVNFILQPYGYGSVFSKQALCFSPFVLNDPSAWNFCCPPPCSAVEILHTHQDPALAYPKLFCLPFPDSAFPYVHLHHYPVTLGFRLMKKIDKAFGSKK